jgi:hypothetical protein
MLVKPAVLGFKAKRATLLHEQEKHEQGLVLVDERPASMGLSRVVWPKALKEGKQQGDIVGQGGCTHGRSSGKACRLFTRKDLPVPAMSTHLCTPLS